MDISMLDLGFIGYNHDLFHGKCRSMVFRKFYRLNLGRKLLKLGFLNSFLDRTLEALESLDFCVV